ncbi:MAG: hypothetical protein ABI948_08110 [Thermoleophilia bacterium]
MSVGRDLHALEAVRLVAAEYGIEAARLKPCVALVLDGNLGGADRHEAAFVLAIECRAFGFDEARTAGILAAWAKKIGYRTRDAQRAIRSAFGKDSAGRWRYHPPGLTKKPGTVYERVLAATCADVGCPAKCAPLAAVHQGPKAETFARFDRLGWPKFLRRQRRESTLDVYRALCELEHERGIAPGGPIRASYKQLAKLTGRDHSKIGKNLDRLQALGLAGFERGSGSGPHARDRSASLIHRTVPIPDPPALSTAIKYRWPAATHIGGLRNLDIGGRRAASQNGDDPETLFDTDDSAEQRRRHEQGL